MVEHEKYLLFLAIFSTAGQSVTDNNLKSRHRMPLREFEEDSINNGDRETNFKGPFLEKNSVTKSTSRRAPEKYPDDAYSFRPDPSRDHYGHTYLAGW